MGRRLAAAALLLLALTAVAPTGAHGWASYANTVTCTTAPGGYPGTMAYRPTSGVFVTFNANCAAVEAGGASTPPYVPPPGPARITIDASYVAIDSANGTGTLSGRGMVELAAERYSFTFIAVFVGGVGTLDITSAVDDDPFHVVGIGTGSGIFVEPCHPNLACQSFVGRQLDFTMVMA